LSWSSRAKARSESPHAPPSGSPQAARGVTPEAVAIINDLIPSFHQREKTIVEAALSEPAELRVLATGKAGLWALAGDRAVRIDPATGAVTGCPPVYADPTHGPRMHA
jgi:hypothetical protein